MSAYVKIPLQLLVLSTGVLVFVYYLFQAPPMLFNRVYDARVAAGPYAAEYASLEQQFTAAIGERRQAALQSDREAFLTTDARVVAIRGRASEIVKQTTGDTRYTDVNYVFSTFITTRMPIGLVGLMIAAIFAAAMSASAGELNSLASATVIDFYRRHFVKEATDTHYLNVSKLATIGWGLFACVVAMYAANQGSLIEVVNRYGSILLRLAARRVRPGDSREARDGRRRVLGAHRRHGGGAHGGVLTVDARHRVSLAQPDWGSRGGGGGNGDQCDHEKGEELRAEGSSSSPQPSAGVTSR